MSSIIDNKRDNLLVTEVNRLLDVAEFSSMAVGFFYLSGFEAIREKLHKVQRLRLLIGSRTDRKTLEEMVAGHVARDHVKHELRKQQVLNKSQKRTEVERTKRAYMSDLATMPQDADNSVGLRALSDLIREKRIEIRVYAKGVLHSKAYIFETPGNVVEGIAVVGSSNLSISGLAANSELNVKVTNQNDYQDVCNWFEALWDESEPFSEELIEVAENSWALKQATPYEVYIKTLYNLLHDRVDIREHLMADTGDFQFSKLYSFQRDAVNMAIDRLESPSVSQNGVFISDVVGLGKSYIALAILSWYWSQRGTNALIICPPSLQPMWEAYKDEYKLNCRILPSSELAQPEGDEAFTLNEKSEFDGYGLVIIDEAHNFRNPDTQRYRVLAPYLLGRKVVLLTATPQNKSVWDIYHQIKLFHQSDTTDLNIAPNNLKDYFKTYEENPAKIAELLQNFIIRRTRNDIVTNPRYADLNITFPSRRLRTVEYLIDETYSVGEDASIYATIMERMFSPRAKNRFGYSIYSLTSFLKPKHKNEKKYQGLSHFGELAMGLLRTLLFKRLESSATAFSGTLKRMIDRNEAMLASVRDRNVVLTGRAEQMVLLFSDPNATTESLGLTEYSADDFEKEVLIAAIAHDIQVLRDVHALTEPIVRNERQDAKFDQFIQQVIEPNLDEKILIFSEFTETVEYLYRRTKRLYPSVIIESISSHRTDKEAKKDIVRRFSPRSQTNGVGLNEHEKEVQLLFTSDVLSEGQNLQDARIVVNYDFHWNPVRLIQRIGRVDRIGSTADEILVYNFMPDENIEQQLDLRGRVQRRINQIHSIFGSDSAILSQDEQLNEESMFSIYSAEDERILDVDKGISTVFDEAESELNKLRSENPKEYDRITQMNDGIRAAFAGDENGVYAYLRCGKLHRLYYHDGKKVSDSIAEIIGRIKATPDTPVSVPMDIDEHTKRMAPLYKQFKDELIKRVAQFSTNEITREQQDFQMRLREAYNFFTQGDTVLTARIDRLNAIFSREIPDYAKRQLRVLKRQKLSDDLMFEALEQLVVKANIEQFQRQALETEEQVVVTVCSEGILTLN